MAADENQNSTKHVKSDDETPKDPSDDIVKAVEEGRTLLDDIRRRNGTTSDADPDLGQESATRKFNLLRPLILVLLVLGAGAALYFYYAGGSFDEYLPATDRSADRVAALEAEIKSSDARVDALEQRLSGMSSELAALSRKIDASDRSFDAALAAIPKATSGPSVDATEIAALEQEIADLRSEIQAIPLALIAPSTTPSTTGNDDALSTATLELTRRLEARIAALEARSAPSGGVSGASLRYVAFGSLKAASADSLPFGAELTAFRHAIEDDDVLAGLAVELVAFSRTGIPSFATLKTSFAAEARSALKSIKAVDEDASMLDQIWSEVTSLVTVRRKGELEGDDAISIFARAEQRLEAGSLDDAVDELSFLPADASAAFSFWFSDAKSRLASDSILRMIEARLLDVAPQSPAGQG